MNTRRSFIRTTAGLSLAFGAGLVSQASALQVVVGSGDGWICKITTGTCTQKSGAVTYDCDVECTKFDGTVWTGTGICDKEWVVVTHWNLKFCNDLVEKNP
jgi:hypothetical protein